MVIQGHPGRVIYGQELKYNTLPHILFVRYEFAQKSAHIATQKSAQWPAHDLRNLENARWMKMSGSPGVRKIIQL